MQKKILEFTNILRKSGIRVSTAESIDAFKALEVLSFDDRGKVKLSLKAVDQETGKEIPGQSSGKRAAR